MAKIDVIRRALATAGDWALANDPSGTQRVFFRCFHCGHWVTSEAVHEDHLTPQGFAQGTPMQRALWGVAPQTVLSCAECNVGPRNNQQIMTRGQYGNAKFLVINGLQVNGSF